MTTVGFGDVPPRTNLEILMSLMVMAIGIGTYSYMMGNTSSILTHIDGRKRKLQVPSNFINNYCIRRKSLH